MTARFWLPIVFGLGKIAFFLVLILLIFVAVANGQEKTQMEGAYFVPLTSGDIEKGHPAPSYDQCGLAN